MLESGDRKILVADDESSDDWTTKSPSGRIEKVRAWGGERFPSNTHHISRDIPGGQCTCVGTGLIRLNIQGTWT